MQEVKQNMDVNEGQQLRSNAEKKLSGENIWTEEAGWNVRRTRRPLHAWHLNTHTHTENV